ncbi:tRNA pseudouridine synthase 1 (PUS1) [Vairimorpha necatrix]|uniref:tRNA pseudouridine synthase 1 (PUS1) n=1 Tax=Vairimorpha necatrix TaxID=6039 RepID=A0AAX4JFA3_9MICR
MKIKVGLCIGYNGNGYSGLQLNGDLNTIEKAISECLFECSAIKESNAKDPSKIHLKSASRTDKGVHAAFNLVCCKIECEITKELISNLKEKLLTRNIYLYKIVRLTKSFIPNKLSLSRIYEYIVPTYFLKRQNFLKEIDELTNKDLKTDKTIKREYTEEDIKHIIGSKANEEDIDKFKEIFTKFLGTKNFHNFTTMSNPKGKQRHIKDIKYSDTYNIDGIEYIKIRMEGQSFLLHQIRKMTYFAILLTRYNRENYETIFEKAFSLEYLHIPKGPGEYLLLDSPLFMEIKDKGKMTDTLDVDHEEKEKYKKNIVYNIIHTKSNLYSFLFSLDASKFHNDKLNYLK